MPYDVHLKVIISENEFSMFNTFTAWHFLRTCVLAMALSASLYSTTMSADNVALPVPGAAIDRYFLPAGLTAANPQQRRANGMDTWTDRQTDGRTPDSHRRPQEGATGVT